VKSITFSSASVRAILKGKKTQTRRVARAAIRAEQRYGDLGKPVRLPDGSWSFWHSDNLNNEIARITYPNGGEWRCPYGNEGARLRVREAFWVLPWLWDGHTDEPQPIYYDADIDDPRQIEDYVKKPALYMPRWASRITLEITNVRIERVQDITLEDVEAEGIEIDNRMSPSRKGPSSLHEILRSLEGLPELIVQYTLAAQHAFAELWDEINAKRGYPWDSNPWVWVLDFRVVPTQQKAKAHNTVMDDLKKQNGKGK